MLDASTASVADAAHLLSCAARDRQPALRRSTRAMRFLLRRVRERLRDPRARAAWWPPAGLPRLPSSIQQSLKLGLISKRQAPDARAACRRMPKRARPCSSSRACGAPPAAG